jgi:hypothetical protein
MHGVVQAMRLQGDCFMGALPALPSSFIAAQSSRITVCSAFARDRAINDADAMACSPIPITKARLVKRISNF